MLKSTFYFIITLFIFLGIFIAYERHTHTHMPLKAHETKPVWLIEAKITFTPHENSPITVRLNIPHKVPNYRIVSQQSASAGYGFNVLNGATNKTAQWSIRKATDKQTLYYKIQAVQEVNPEALNVAPTQEYRNTILWSKPQELAIKELSDKAKERSSDDVTFTQELIKLFSSSSMKENVSLLLTQHHQADVLNAILHQAGIISRVSMGLTLEDARRNQSLHPIIEIFTHNSWVLFDAKTGTQNLKEETFLWHRGGSLVELSGAQDAHVSFSMVKQNVPALQLAKITNQSNTFDLFSMHALPIEEQSIFKMLLLLPMGALVTVFMRLIVGLKTSGTFMPVLIAMAFLQTTLLPGLATFIMIVAVGLMLRSYLAHLNLLLVSRIATTIIIVIFIIILASLLGHHLGFSTGMTVAVFPIIILAWTIERMSILWEEDGAKEVLVQGFGTLVVASLSYAVMQTTWVGHLSFNFPELNLVVLAFLMLMGRYTGYRLLELYRFRDFKA